MSVAAILVAAGTGHRLGADRPKAFVELAGAPLFVHAVQRLLAADSVVVVVPAGLVEQARLLLQSWPAVRCVAGGASRHDSVAAGLAALPAAARTVLVHDAARCLAPPTLAAAVASAVLEGHPAVVPGLAVTDTIKQVSADGTVTSTLDRAVLRVIQTPQGFDRAVLEQAHRLVGTGSHTGSHTDDAELVSASGYPVLVIPGDPLAIKITTPADLAYAGWLLAS